MIPVLSGPVLDKMVFGQNVIGRKVRESLVYFPPNLGSVEKYFRKESKTSLGDEIVFGRGLGLPSLNGLTNALVKFGITGLVSLRL